MLVVGYWTENGKAGFQEERMEYAMSVSGRRAFQAMHDQSVSSPGEEDGMVSVLRFKPYEPYLKSRGIELTPEGGDSWKTY